MQLSDDRTQATLAINKTLTAPEIENLIRELAMLRSQMTPEVTPAPQDSNGSGVPVMSQDNPTLAIQLAPRTTLRAGFEYFHDERVADRGIRARVGDAEWAVLCQQLEARFARGEFRAGALECVEAVTQALARHFPPDGHPHNELPDRVVLL